MSLTLTNLAERRVFFPSRILEIENLIEEDYFSDDVLVTCNVAAKTGVPLFICHATLALEKRQEALDIWRADQITSALAADELIVAYLDEQTSEDEAEIRNGNVSLSALSESLRAFNDSLFDERMAVKRQAKIDWQLVIASQVADANGLADAFPRFLVLVTSGEDSGAVTFWRKRVTAAAYAKDSGESFLLMQLEKLKALPYAGLDSRFSL